MTKETVDKLNAEVAFYLKNKDTPYANVPAFDFFYDDKGVVGTFDEILDAVQDNELDALIDQSFFIRRASVNLNSDSDYLRSLVLQGVNSVLPVN